MSAPERVLCYSTLLDDTIPQGSLARHPIYSYSEALQWPPANWRAYSCLHCCQPLEHPPVPLPQDQDSACGNFVVYGIFCSFSCAKGYLFEAQPWSAGDKLLLLEEMAATAFGQTTSALPAPPRQRLRMFGGDLTPEEFRKEHAFLSRTYSPPLLAHPECYERAGKSEARPSTSRMLPFTQVSPRMDLKDVEAGDGGGEPSTLPSVASSAAPSAAGGSSATPYSDFCNRTKGEGGQRLTQATASRDEAGTSSGTLHAFLKKRKTPESAPFQG
jgi:hypothetical protein